MIACGHATKKMDNQAKRIRNNSSRGKCTIKSIRLANKKEG